MTEQELKEAYQELKDEGLDDETIVKSLGQLFTNDELSKDELVVFMKGLGYELGDELASLSDEELKKKLGGDEDGSDLSEDEAEEIEESGDKKAPDAPKEDGEDDKKDDKDEEDEKDKALKLMGL